jgi:signal peptidase I
MRPALEPGDWLLADPTVRAWPRRGSIVVVREPESELLVVKRVAARPGDVVRTTDGPIRLAPDRAWLLGDDRVHSIDSRTYGPVPLERLVARAWFRYGPRARIGRLDRSPSRPARP